MVEMPIEEKRADLRFTVECVSCGKVMASAVPASRMVRGWQCGPFWVAKHLCNGRDSTSRPCADCDSGAPNIPPHECTKYDA